jgi:hypothetical protein
MGMWERKGLEVAFRRDGLETVIGRASEQPWREVVEDEGGRSEWDELQRDFKLRANEKI